ncbi:MAG: TonB-dependent receptor [Acidobacteria bacterium]|nr:TonB-dependent receptor [Acidobacteriota bacterium]
MSRTCIVLRLFVLLSFSSILFGQSQQGRIAGRVTDSTGAVIPDAKVTVTDIATGTGRELRTNGAGDYFAPDLSAGVYSVTVEMTGFQKFVRTNIRLEVASNVQIDFRLQPGQVSESIQVTGEPLVDTMSDTLGGTLSNRAINELPLQGRDIQNLLALRPGVQRSPGGGLLSVTSNGNRSEDNNFIVDGVDNNDPYYGDTVFNGVGVQGTPATHLPLDAIQEFNTEENQGADYGWKPGVVVNVGLKGGTNQFHGTSYYFHRNVALDARNYFNEKPQPISALLLHQFGASAGGPIIRDKWFIFGVYEGVRHKVGNPFETATPLTTSLLAQGKSSSYALEYSLPDAIADCTAANTCNPLSLQIAKLFPTNPGNAAAIAASESPAGINLDLKNLNREDNFLVKSDFNLTKNQVISGRWVYGNSDQTEEDGIVMRPEFLSLANTKSTVAGLNWTWTPSSSWINQAAFGFNNMWQAISTADHNVDVAKVYGINTGITDPKLGGLPCMVFTDFDDLGGSCGWPLETTPNYNYQFTDNVSWSHGAHQIRFGGEIRRGGTDNYRASYGRGRIRFRSLTDFVTGNVRDGSLTQGDPTRHVTLNGYAGFIRDDWRVSQRLSLNLGLRYDVQMPIKEEHNLIANFIPDKGLVQVGKGIDSPYDTQWSNFSPRFGMAWDVHGTGKTVFRAGTALIYEVPPIRMFINGSGLNTNPTGAIGVDTGNIDVFNRTISKSQINWTSAGPVFDLTSPASSTCDADSTCDILGVLPDLKTPRVLSWNANIQQQLSRTTVLQIAYVAQKGIDLYSHRDINQVDPILDDGSEQFGRPFTYNCPVSEGGGGRGGPCFPWIEYAAMTENLGKSRYDGLQVTLTQKSWKGLDFLAGYTWAHALDNGTSNLSSDAPQDAFNYDANWGNGDADIRNRFTMALTYNLPERRAPLGLLKGWQFTSIVTEQTGLPYDPYDGSNDISATFTYGYERWNFAGNAGDMKASTKGIPYFPDTSFGPDAVGDDSPGGVTNNAQCLANASLSQLESYGCYQMGSAVMTPPEPLTFGNMRRNILHAPAFQNWDTSVTKLVKFNDRVSMQLRSEFFNILNHPNFYASSATSRVAGGTVGQLVFTPDVYQANPVVGSGGSRHIQLGLKVIW